MAQVKVFGSFATGLYLPTSDVDVRPSACLGVESNPHNLEVVRVIDTSIAGVHC